MEEIAVKKFYNYYFIICHIFSTGKECVSIKAFKETARYISDALWQLIICMRAGYNIDEASAHNLILVSEAYQKHLSYNIIYEKECNNINQMLFLYFKNLNNQQQIKR